MTLARLFFLCCVFLLLAVAAAGYHIYRSYPHNLETALQQLFEPYGISRVELDGLKITTGTLNLEGLALAGTNAEQPFTAAVQSISIGFHWRQLVSGSLHSVEIAKITVTFADTPEPSDTPGAPVDLNTMLPQALLADLPITSVVVRRWEINYPQGKDVLQATGTLRYQDRTLRAEANLPYRALMVRTEILSSAESSLAMQLNVADPEQELLNIQLALKQPDQVQWQWEVAGVVHYSPLLAALASGDLGVLLAEQPALPQGLSLEGATTLKGTVTHPARWPFEAVAGSPSGFALAAAMHAEHTITTLALNQDLLINEAKFTTDTAVDTGAIRMTLHPASFTALLNTEAYGLSTAQRQWLGWKTQTPAVVSIQDSVALEWQPEHGRLTVEPAQLAFNLGDSFSRIKLTLDETGAQRDRSQFLTTNASGTLHTRLRRQALPATVFSIATEGPPEHWRVAVSVRDVAQSMTAAVQGQLNATTGKGQFDLSTQITDLSYAVSALSGPLQAFEIITEPVKISSGTLLLDTRLSTATFGFDGAQQTSRLQVQGVSGQFTEYPFEQLNVEAQWQGIERWQTLKPASVTLRRLQAGFDISNLSATVRLPSPTPPQAPQLTIDDFSADMFGGSVYLPEMQQWQVGAPANTLRVRASNWELRQLVALQQGQDIEARGVLEGELPLLVEDGRVIIENGFLRAIPPGGSIRYQANDSASALARSNEQLGMALELLEDFQFKVLSTDVHLDKAGNLHLGLALSGSNPEQFNGRQVNFNINLDQNIDPLLQSLRLSDTLVERLEKKIR